MESVVVKLRDDSLLIPFNLGDRLGWAPGTTLTVEPLEQELRVRRFELSAAEIARKAGIYLAKYVGEATDVKTPVRVNGKWRVEAVLSHRPQTIGFLTFTLQGELISEESDSPAKLRGLEHED